MINKDFLCAKCAAGQIFFMEKTQPQARLIKQMVPKANFFD